MTKANLKACDDLEDPLLSWKSRKAWQGHSECTKTKWRNDRASFSEQKFAQNFHTKAAPGSFRFHVRGARARGRGAGHVRAVPLPLN
jgi:hypothetical protein